MKADPADQRRLLELQQTDTALTQLVHRRARLAETAKVAQLRGEVTELTDRKAERQALTSDLDRDVARVEAEIEQVRSRAQRDRQRQSSGAAAPKELESLSHELETLARRQSELEDQQLELMERREGADADADAAETALEERQAQLEHAQQQETSKLAEIDAEQAQLDASREQLQQQIPDDLAKLYEKIRGSNPTAAAELRRRRCESCRIEASGGELSELRAAADDDVMRCDNCRAILVRTAESGL